MKLILVDSVGSGQIGELEIPKEDIIAVRQNYEASIVTLKNGQAFRIQGIYRRLDELKGR